MRQIIEHALWLLAVLIFALFVMNGDFVDESVQGETHVYAYKPWVPLFAIFGGVGFTIWISRIMSGIDAWVGNKHNVGPYFAIVMAVVTALGAFGFHARVVEVNESGFKWAGKENVQFADVMRIRMLSEQQWEHRGQGSGGWRTHYKFVFEQTANMTTEISVNDGVSQLAAAHIMEIASERGIPISKPYSTDTDRWYTKP